jgi:small-conductance mechanosensitive channel
MRPVNVEITMGHDIGVSKSYYKPTEKEVMEDYLKAVDSLTISDDKIVLQKQVIELKEKTRDNEYIIKSKLQEKDNDIAELKAAVAFLTDKVNAAVIANEPSSKMISDQKGIPKEITFKSNVGNAKAEII